MWVTTLHQFDCICHVLYRLADVLQGSGHSLTVTTLHTIDHSGNALQHISTLALSLKFLNADFHSVINLSVLNAHILFYYHKYTLYDLHPHCRNSCQLHQQSDQEEPLDTVSTWESDQQLQVPVWYK